MIETLQIASGILESLVSFVALWAIIYITNRFVRYLESREAKDDLIIELLRERNEQKK